MKALPLLGAVLLAATISMCDTAAAAQKPMPRPSSLPNVTLDCYQSFTTLARFPGSRFDDGEFPIDGDNFEKPLVRYRMQVVDQSTLKVISDPTRPALRKEHGVRVFEMMRDFTNKHLIVGWNENDKAGSLIRYIVNFDDLLLSKLQVTNATAHPAIAGVNLSVLKCQKVP